MTDVASFDVFDTVLIRPVGDPSAMFLALGRRLLRGGIIGCSAEAFARARIEAERRQSANRGAENIKLAHIYGELARSLGVDAETRDRILGEEIALESRLISAVPGARAEIDEARRRGLRIVFASDMYLEPDVIRRWLEREGCFRPGDGLHVSSQFGASKSSGRLYRHLIRAEGVRPDRVVHRGNHPVADVEAALGEGIRVAPFPGGNPNRFERILESHSWSTEGFGSFLAGASWIARLSTDAAGEHDRAIREVAAGVIAPTLVGFAIWVLRRAHDLGLRRLYFLSRDGQVVLEVARALSGPLGLDRCELRYLHGSRQAWHLPALTEIGRAQRSWILDDADFVSVESLLARVGVEPAEVREALGSVGLGDEGRWRHNLSAAERASVARLLDGDALPRLILEKGRAARSSAIGYLAQEGVIGQDQFGIVDLGWSGRTQESLAGLVAGAGGVRPHGFYFGKTSDRRSEACGPIEAYFYDARDGLGHVRLGSQLTLILESFCAGDHGRVIGYRASDGRFVPILEADENSRAAEWGLGVLRRTIAAFVGALVLDRGLTDPGADVRPLIADALHQFHRHPARPEAEAWSRIMFEDDQSGFSLVAMASPYGWGNMLRFLLTGETGIGSRVRWHWGSLAASPPSIVLAYRVIGRGRSLASRAVAPLERRLRRLVDRLRRIARPWRGPSEEPAAGCSP